MATPRFVSATNYFVPSATGQVVGFIRKPGSYKLMDYVQLVSSKREDSRGHPICLYGVLDPDAPIRVVTDQEYAWEDGDDSPEGAGMLINFKWEEVRMFRRAYPYRLGEQAVDTSEIPLMAIHRDVAMNVAMINKTRRVWTLLDAASNWPTYAKADADSLNGGKGKWTTASATEGSPHYLAIKRSINSALLKVNQNTNGIVRPEDMRLVVSPILAADMGQSAEITDYLKSSPFAKMVADGIERGGNSMYGCPDYYAGVKIVVEDAMIDTSRPNGTGAEDTESTRGYIKDPSTAVLLSRKGGLDGVEGSPSFSTVQVYYYKYELAVEERHDTWNKRHDGRVVDQFKEVLTAARAGFRIANCR